MKSSFAFFTLWLASCLLSMGAGSLNGVAVTAWNGAAITAWNGTSVSAAGGGGGGPTYLLNEGFEGTGYENTWVETGSGTADEDYATSPAPLVGSQSLRIAVASQTRITVYTFGTDQSTVWVYFQVNFVTLPANAKVFFRLRNSSGTTVYSLQMSGTQLRCTNGTTSATTTDSLSSGTTYHIFGKFVKGTGSDGYAECGFSTDGTRPTSGNKFKSVSTGNATTDAHDVAIGPENSSTWEGIFDKVLADDALIDSNP